MLALRLLGCVGLTLALFPDPLHGYVDPSAGSIVLQILAAGFLTGLITFRRWWGALTDLVRRRPGRGNPDQQR